MATSRSVPRNLPILLATGTLVASLMPFAAALASPVTAAASGTQLIFTSQPGGGPAWQPFYTQPVIELIDSGGAPLTSDNTTQVRLTITAGSPAGNLACSGGTTRTASAGIVTFFGCQIDTAGTGFKLTATDVGNSGNTNDSTPFNITPAQNVLVFTVNPGGGAANVAFPTQPVLQIRSPSGSDVAQAGVTVNLQIAANPGLGSLTCTNGQSRVTDANGTATFSGCKIDKTGSGYTITASATATAPMVAPSGVTSPSFDVVPGTAAKIAFTIQPGGSSAGLSLNPQPVVAIQDASGYTVAGSSALVTLAIAAPPATSGAALSCTGGYQVAAVNGIATFSGCSINLAGIGYKLTATASGLPVATSNAFTIDPAPATQIAFTTQPSSTAGANTAFAAQPVVTIKDATGKTVTSSSSVVTLALGSNPSGGTLACTGGLAKGAISGVATFGGCSIDKMGAGYTLTATMSGVPIATSTAITITPGAAAKLAFQTQPGGGAVSTAFATQPVVVIQDSSGNTVTSSSLSVALAITTGTGTSGAALACSGGTAPAAVGGVVTYSGCSINKVGSSYTLKATSGSLVAATSVSFNIIAGAAAKLAFTTQPVGAAVGVAFATQPVLTIQDSAGNTVSSSSASISLTISSGTGTAGASLTCTSGTSVGASAGVAGFGGCAIDRSGTGYMLMATSPGLASAVSMSFSITAGAPAKLAFGTQPGGAVVNAALSPQPVVYVEDAAGNIVTTSTLGVTLSIGTNPTGGKLTCTALSKAAASGIATFAACAIDKVGASYTITATASGVLGDTSVAFSIVAGPPSKLAFTTQPAGAVYQTAFTTQPVVAVQDGSGNTATSYGGNVVLSITPGTGASGATLTCSSGLAVAAVSGVATFGGCTIDKPATTYSLTATATGVTNATSAAFVVAPGAAAGLSFGTQPVGASAGVAFATQPSIRVVDASGNTVAGSSAIVTLAITGGTGTAGASLSCTGGTSKAATSGVVAFAGCTIDKVGTGYTLTATSTSLTSAVSAAISISAGAAAKLAFTTQPGGAAVGADFTSQPVVAIQDAGGNLVSSTLTVTLSITTGTGTSGATVTCSSGLTVAAVSGVATFSGCRIGKVGSGYTLKASSGTLAAATSSAFAVAAGTAAKVVVTTQPVGAAYSQPFATAPVVAIQDAYGNTVTTSTASVTIAITTGTGSLGATLTCSGSGAGGLTVSAVAGIATFPACAIDTVGTGYTLTASSPGLTAATTSALAIVAGLPTRLAFTVQPSANVSVATAFATQPTVAIEDAAGNVVTASTISVTLSLTGGTAGAVLSCNALTKAAVAGLSVFAGCKIDRPGSGYTLVASAPGLTSASSSTISIASGPAAKLVFTTQPVGATLATSFATMPVVTVEDTAGNTVTSSGAVILLTIVAGTGTTGASLTCGSATAVAGIATFSGCSIDKAGAGYTLKASSGTLASATSSAVAIGAGPATQLLFGTQPSGAAVGTSFTAQPVVRVADSGGGTSTGSSASVTLALAVNPSGATLTCTGGLTVTAVAGIAAFSGCALDKVGSGYVITASSAGLTQAASAIFSVVAGAATKLVFTTLPGTSAPYGVSLGDATVTIEDAAGNAEVGGASAKLSITLSITPGTGTAGAKLSCTGGVTKAAVAGVATFSGCAIDKAGTGYTITASSGALTVAVTSAITITAGPASKLAFSTSPSATAGAGVAFASQPVVVVQDSAGNTVTSGSLVVTLSLSGGPAVSAPGGAGTLSCTGGLTKTAVAGVATFAGCSIDKVGTGYAITATVAGLTVAKSSAIAISAGPGAKLAFTTQPTGAAGGAALGKQPVITIEDASGNTDLTSTVTVTLAISSGTGATGATLTCTGGLTKAAVKGVATFAGCTIDKAGTGYKLVATAGTLTSTTSSALDINQGPAKQAGFTTQPAGGPGGLAFPSQPLVAIQDAGGATVASSTLPVTLSITAGTGTSGAVLSCDGGLTVNAVAGIATFAGCTIDRAGTGYTLTATAQGLTVAVSKPLDMSAPVAQVKVTPATTTINQGSAISLSIAFSFGGANKTVQLQESTDAVMWRTVSDVVMDANGTASFLYYIATNRWFRASYAGDSELLPGIGKAVRVLVRTSVAIRPTNGSSIKTIKRRTAITFTAFVNAGGATVPPTVVTWQIYKLVGKSWAFVTRRVATTNALGRATLRWTFSSTGSWAVRASSASTWQNANSPWTKMERFKVV